MTICLYLFLTGAPISPHFLTTLYMKIQLSKSFEGHVFGSSCEKGFGQLFALIADT